ncbi:centriole, cilia and spindle-associated protein [Gouania willdenowi]|uniref:Centriole, cilia and spindle-associated protein-like n=1 Tax=Gouania willdenowi TaxID=441366 RepID=A0A8C5H474_GOUWI|nr:centriole, cilia and spindle-associated protein-like [Gouania willdenowi]XP_028294914.1 centriole, cilia and spindle-associated protein-like [Gouania willdenowi]
MAIKRIRSEYMKKFKDPKWETYTKCYEEMLKYRLTRRLLEHTHNPWFWSGSDSDSDTGGRSPAPPPSPPAKNQVQAQPSGARAGAELEECEQTRRDQHEAPTTEPVSRLPLQDEIEDTPALCGSKSGGVGETRVPQEEREEQRSSSRSSKQFTASHRVQVKDNRRAPSTQTKPSKSVKQTTRSQRIRPEPLSQTKEDSKDRRHPFALYASGERDADIAARKTHNVGPAASTNEIHESALRALTRRRVERHVQTQRSELRRAKSADPGKAKSVVQPEFNPWLTEYMRCFSTRSR